MWRLLAPLLLAIALLSACGDSYESQLADLEEFVDSRSIGGRDYWLIKTNAFGDADSLALIFGYMDDNAACVELAGLLNEKYPTGNYRCRPAN